MTQVLRAGAALRRDSVYLVTVRHPQTISLDPGCRVHFVRRIIRNPILLFVNLLQSVKILTRERPQAVVTTGSGEVVPTCVVAKCLGSRIVFIESFARVTSPSATGRILRHFADVVLVQWEPLLAEYPNGRYAGPYFVQKPAAASTSAMRVLVTVGTQTRGFDRLVKAVDHMRTPPGLSLDVTVQIGTSRYEPKQVRWFRFAGADEFLKLVESSDVVVTHSGAGIIGQSLELGKRVVVVPRDPLRHETLWTHDAELPLRLSELGIVKMSTVEDLPETLVRISGWTPRILEPGPFREEILRALNH